MSTAAAPSATCRPTLSRDQVGHHPCGQLPVGVPLQPVLVLPPTTSAVTAVILDFTSAGTFGSRSWYGASPTSPTTLPPLYELSWTALTMLNTPGVINFIALETRMLLASGSDRNWSVSTPMPRTEPPLSTMASKPPLPVLPPAAKMMSAP